MMAGEGMGGVENSEGTVVTPTFTWDNHQSMISQQCHANEQTVSVLKS
jgi:hypothetical protein